MYLQACSGLFFLETELQMGGIVDSSGPPLRHML